MATIECFEDIEAWKLAREFYNVIANYIDEGLRLIGTSLSTQTNDWITRVQSFDPFPNNIYIFNRQKDKRHV